MSEKRCSPSALAHVGGDRVSAGRSAASLGGEREICAAHLDAIVDRTLAASLFRWGRTGEFLGATDGRNPLRTYGRAVTSDIKALSDLLAVGATSDHEKVLRFIDYLAQIRIGVASDLAPDVSITERVGACGSISGALLALSVSQGMDGRYVNFYNYPKDNGHTVVEDLSRMASGVSMIRPTAFTMCDVTAVPLGRCHPTRCRRHTKSGLEIDAIRLHASILGRNRSLGVTSFFMPTP